jgi:hypothetical protein
VIEELRGELRRLKSQERRSGQCLRPAFRSRDEVGDAARAD